MGSSGVFVSYYALDKRHADYLFATHFLGQLRTRGVEVVAESSSVPGHLALQYLSEQLSRCEWLILILTPEALQSRQIQLEVETALKLAGQQRLRGVLALMTVPCTLEDMPPTWSAIRIFDASQDYPRALAGMALVLNLVRFQAPPPAVLPAPVRPSFLENTRQLFSSPFQRHRRSSALRTFPSLFGWQSRRGLVAALTIALIFLIIFTSVFFVHARSTTTGSIRPTPTVLPLDPTQLFAYLTHQSPTLQDPLSGQDRNQWDENTSNAAGCVFRGGKYQAGINTQENYTDCLEHIKTYSNFAFQVQMQIVLGSAGGLIFRANSSLTRFYRFSLDNAEQKYKLLVCKTCTSEQDTSHVDILFSATGPIPVQLNQTYTLTVIANKNLLYLFVNGEFLTKASDGTAQSGGLGFYAFTFRKQTEVEFSDMKVWAL